MAPIRPTFLCFTLLAAVLTGCANAPPANETDMAMDDTNAMAAGEARSERVYPGRIAAAGDVIPGQEVMLERVGLAVGVIQLHPGQLYEFGRPQAEIVAMATNLRGAPTGSGRTEECGAGPIDHVDFGNLRVNFQNGRFVGWDASPGTPRLRDEWSFGIGSPRDEIENVVGDGPARVERTTLGIEFESNGYHGLLSSDRPDARVTDLWAGLVCVHR